jgi:predicted NBD/HSP70 family sugar kinase
VLPVRHIGIGISGLLNVAEGISNVFPRFEEWVDVPLRDLIEKRFDIPTTLDNHIAAIALAESVCGNYRGFENALYVQLGPGLGAGIVIGGKIYRGSKRNVGEFGHTTITENGPICYCGNYGCLESVASDYAMVQRAEAALKEGVNTRIPEFTPEPAHITPGSIFRAAREGDRFASNLVEKVGTLLGTGIGNLVNLFGPEVIILGGTMAEAGDLILDPICRTVRAKALERMEKDVEIRTSSFGKDEAIKGATTLALFQHFARSM